MYKIKIAVRVQAASICKARRKLLLAVPRHAPARATGIYLHDPMVSDGDGVDYESLSCVLAVASAVFAKPNHNVSSRGRVQSVSGKIY